jgi:hypothetical protein
LDRTRQFLARAGTMFYICSSSPNGERPLVRARPTRPNPPSRSLACSAKRGPPKKGRTREAGRRLPEPRRVDRRAGGARRRDGARHAQIYPRASRSPRVPAARRVLALQVSRLNEALVVAYSAMSGANLHAVDRVVTIVRELDRYHGFAVADEAVPPGPRRLELPSPAPLTLEGSRAGTEPNGAANR